MDALVWALVWSAALLTHTPNLKAESSESVPASTRASPNEAGDLSATSKFTDPKDALGTDLAQGTGRSGGERGGVSASPPTSISISTANRADTTPFADPAIDTESKSVTGANVTQDFTSSLIPLWSTTVTPGSSIPLSTNLSEEHRDTSPSTISDTTPAVSLIPPSIPASTLKDVIAGSEKKSQAGPSELDVGDEDLSRVPSPSPPDPLLAGLISIFIVSTALLSVMLFLRFRQQNGHPEFHRLQDLPMDDLLEDTPLARHLY